MEIELLSITEGAEELIERAGRISHLSSGKGDREKFIKMLIKRGHHSVLEHASASFRIKGVSRALTHQLVRHRLASYTQKSQRYVSEQDFDYVEPISIKEKKDAHLIFIEFMEKAKETYSRLKELGQRNEDARFVLPNAVCTEIVVTANLREWRHIIELRGVKGAQWEIRDMTIKILKILKKHTPTVFFDFEIDEKNAVAQCKMQSAK